MFAKFEIVRCMIICVVLASEMANIIALGGLLSIRAAMGAEDRIVSRLSL